MEISRILKIFPIYFTSKIVAAIAENGIPNPHREIWGVTDGDRFGDPETSLNRDRPGPHPPRDRNSPPPPSNPDGVW